MKRGLPPLHGGYRPSGVYEGPWPPAPPKGPGGGSISAYICYPCAKGEHADHKGNAWEPGIPCECTCPLPPGGSDAE